MAEEFAGKVALVTGGASGIGEVVARMLAQQGASVLVVDLNEESVLEVPLSFQQRVVGGKTN